MDMEERPQPVQVRVGGTAARLLISLMEQVGTDDGGSLIARALGLLDLALLEAPLDGGQRPAHRVDLGEVRRRGPRLAYTLAHAGRLCG